MRPHGRGGIGCLLVLLALVAGSDLRAVTLPGGPLPVDVPPPLRPHWRALFAAEPGWIEYHLAVLDRHLPEDVWAELVGARLCYEGPAWPLRPRFGWPRQDPRSAAPAPHAAVRSVLLRSLRWRPPLPGLLPLYRQLGRRRDLGGLDLARVLDLLAAQRPELAEDRAQALAAGPVGTTATQVALLWLLERSDRLGVDGQAMLREALRPVLAGGGIEERLAVLQALPSAWMHGLLTPVLRAELLAGSAAGPFLAMALPSLPPSGVRDLLPALIDALVDADRLRSMALVDTLAGGAPGTWPEAERARLVAVLQERILASADLAVRHGLLGLLARLDPAAARVAAGFDSPWGVLARQRLRLQEPVAAP